MIIYDMTDEEIREVVRRAARAEGLEEGREEGREQGLEEGREQGLEEGRKLGIELGRVEGRAEVFMVLIKRGFSSQEAQEIAGIDDETVKRMLVSNK